MARIIDIVNAFALYYSSINSRDFSKTLRLNELSERQLHPLVRSFLLGYFGSVDVEVEAELPGVVSGYGRIDYVIKGVAVEFAVRRQGDQKGVILDGINGTEVKKLLKWRGLALLVLFDFSADPLSDEDLERYRRKISMGRGRHYTSAFNVAYYFKQDDACYWKKRTIRALR